MIHDMWIYQWMSSDDEQIMASSDKAVLLLERPLKFQISPSIIFSLVPHWTGRVVLHHQQWWRVEKIIQPGPISVDTILIWYDTIRFYAIWYNTIWYYTILYDTIRYEGALRWYDRPGVTFQLSTSIWHLSKESAPRLHFGKGGAEAARNKKSNFHVCFMILANLQTVVKVAFSWKGLWKYPLAPIFFINFFDGACDWLDLNLNFYPQPITSSVKKLRGKIDENLSKWIFAQNLWRKSYL